MNSSFQGFFLLAGGYSVAIWAVTLAVVTVVISSSNLMPDLGSLSDLIRKLVAVASSQKDLSDEKRMAVDAMVSLYRGLWFMVEMLPVPIMSQVAMLLCLAATLPIAAEWLAIIPAVHIVVWSLVIVALKRHKKRITSVIEAVGASFEGPPLPDIRQLTLRSTIPQLALLAMSIAIFSLYSWQAEVAVVASVSVSLLWSIAQTLRVTYHILITERQAAT